MSEGGVRRGSWVALVALFVLALVEFSSIESRRMGDGFFYYAWLQSVWKDGDVDFGNEYRQYGLAEEPSVAVPLDTGYRRNNFSIGPAVLWSPFFLAGDLYARATGSEDLTGFGPVHQRFVAFGTLVYGFAAVLLVHALLLRYLPAGSALAGALLMWLATPLHWYMLYQPMMSHALATFTAALFLWLWDRNRSTPSSAWTAALGVALGLAVLVRWQNAVLVLLPGFDALRRLRADGLAAGTAAQWRSWLVLGGATLFTVLPQMLAWKTIFGVFVLTTPPQGADYVRFTRPFVLETLFSSRHGLLSWTPVAWLGLLGFLPLARRKQEPRLPVLPLVAVLAIMTYVNMSVGDWWGGGAFGARRFDAALPILAIGVAASFEALTRALARHPGLATGALASLLVLWNLLLTEQYRRYEIPPDDTVAYPDVVAGGARIVSERVGSPWSWPANWIFAWRHGVSPAKYDRLVGRYLFYRNNAVGGRIDLGEDDGSFLAEGWRRPERRDGSWVRQIRQPTARLLLPLESPRDLRLSVRAASRPSGLPFAVRVNGHEVARFLAQPEFETSDVLVRAEHWRRNVNSVELRLERDSDDAYLLVDVIELTPAAAR